MLIKLNKLSDLLKMLTKFTLSILKLLIMKKLITAALAVFTFVAVGAQTDFGITAGYSNMSVKDADSGSGFNVGAFVDLGVSDTFSIQPELVYTSSDIEDLSYNLFSVNAMAKYHASEEFSILAGPQFGFASGDIPDALDDLFGDDFSSLNLGLAFGIAYDFTEDLFAQARYSLMLNDHLDVDGGEAKVNQFSIGLGYRF